MNPLHQLTVQRQPNDTTCGPTCLHALYRHYGDEVPLVDVIDQTHALEEGGTLAVCLGTHALQRGYTATIYTFNLQVFDPTWFVSDVDLSDKLTQQYERKAGRKLREATIAYLEFLDLGGDVRFADLTTPLLTRFMDRNIPVLTGLSATYLYQSPRESPAPRTREISAVADDVGGYPVGHFVVLSGWRKESREIRVADPWHPSPLSRNGQYWVKSDRLKNSILLGVITYDANLLVIEPRES